MQLRQRNHDLILSEYPKGSTTFCTMTASSSICINNPGKKKIIKLHKLFDVPLSLYKNIKTTWSSAITSSAIDTQYGIVRTDDNRDSLSALVHGQQPYRKFPHKRIQIPQYCFQKNLFPLITKKKAQNQVSCYKELLGMKDIIHAITYHTLRNILNFSVI